MINTIIPIFFIMLSGALCRYLKIFNDGDEKTFNNYIYYFSLPAIFFSSFSSSIAGSKNLKLVMASVLPILIIIILFLLLSFFFKINKKVAALYIIGAIFGSSALFGIPFVAISYPNNTLASSLAALYTSGIGVVCVFTILFLLEYFKNENHSLLYILITVLKRLSKNPLVISILCGLTILFLDLNIPAFFLKTLKMIGSTTTPVALFMLGIFLVGRKYVTSPKVLILVFLRIFIVPTIAFLVLKILKIDGMEKNIMILIHSTPGALALLVMSKKYDFFIKEIGSFILISSLLAPFTMNLWLYFLNL